MRLGMLSARHELRVAIVVAVACWHSGEGCFGEGPAGGGARRAGLHKPFRLSAFGCERLVWV